MIPKSPRDCDHGYSSPLPMSFHSQAYVVCVCPAGAFSFRSIDIGYCTAYYAVALKPAEQEPGIPAMPPSSVTEQPRTSGKAKRLFRDNCVSSCGRSSFTDQDTVPSRRFQTPSSETE